MNLAIMKWAVLLTSILAGAMSMDVPLSDGNGIVTKTRVRRRPSITSISCKRYVKSAVVKVKWQGITQIPGPYELFIYYDAAGGLHGLVQKVNLIDFDSNEVRFVVSQDWKYHCEKNVSFDLRGNGKKICTFGTTTLATFCPNVIQKDDEFPDDTDMLFSVPATRRSLTF